MGDWILPVMGPYERRHEINGVSWVGSLLQSSGFHCKYQKQIMLLVVSSQCRATPSSYSPNPHMLASPSSTPFKRPPTTQSVLYSSQSPGVSTHVLLHLHPKPLPPKLQASRRPRPRDKRHAQHPKDAVSPAQKRGKGDGEDEDEGEGDVDREGQAQDDSGDVYVIQLHSRRL